MTNLEPAMVTFQVGRQSDAILHNCKTADAVKVKRLRNLNLSCTVLSKDT